MSIQKVEISLSGQRPQIVYINQGPAGEAGASGGSTSAWNYKAKTNATSGYPGNGYLIWDNATQTSATSIIVSHLNDDDADLELLLGFFVVGQKLFIQDRDESANNQVWQISGTPTLTGANTSTAYYTFPVTLVSSAGAAFNNNHQLLFGAISAATNSVTSATTSDGTATLNTSTLTTGTLTVSTSGVFNATSYTFGTGAASAMKTALAIASADITFNSAIETTGTNSKITTEGSSANIGTEGLNATISTQGDNATISTLGTSATITTFGVNASIFTQGADANIFTQGLNASIYTSGANSYIQTRGTFKMVSGVNNTTTLSHDPSANRAIAFPDASGTVSLIANTETLTNKTLTSPVINTGMSFGAGAAAATRTALGLERAAGFELFGVLRNTAGTWEFINDASHAPFGFSGISQDSTSITLTYTNTATKVGTLIVAPDELFTQRGLIAGASVGLTSAIITLSGLSVGGYIQWNGTAFTTTGAVGINSVTFSGSEISVNHVNNGNANVAAGIMCQSHNYFVIQTSCAATQTRFRLIDPLTGAAVTSFPSGLNLWFFRQPSGLAQPSAVVSATGNLWVYGVMYA